MTPMEAGALWLPIEQNMPLHIVRLGRQPETIFVQNQKFVRELSAAFGGRASRPEGMVTMPSADGRTPIMIAGMGGVEAAELEDIALEALEKDAAQVKKTGGAIDFAAERERRGAAPVETFDTRYREYLQERGDWGRRNIRTSLTTPYMQKVREDGMGKGQAMSAVPSNYPTQEKTA